jgi:hypothetical protein
MPGRYEKPRKCVHCETENPSDFKKGMKSICMKCQRDGHTFRKVAHYCSSCGENKPENFYTDRVTLCKECYNKRKTLQKYPKDMKITPGNKPHYCVKCGTTNENSFSQGMKSMCKECYKTNRVRTIRPSRVVEVSEDEDQKTSSDQKDN